MLHSFLYVGSETPIGMYGIPIFQIQVEPDPASFAYSNLARGWRWVW